MRYCQSALEYKMMPPIHVLYFCYGATLGLQIGPTVITTIDSSSVAPSTVYFTDLKTMSGHVDNMSWSEDQDMG